MTPCYTKNEEPFSVRTIEGERFYFTFDEITQIRALIRTQLSKLYLDSIEQLSTDAVPEIVNWTDLEFKIHDQIINHPRL